ncbi:hypothetical protein [Bradyrhizobium manausense]|uniref:Amidohydrolase n=1 Tax=Bradyrhizobium manausense TaxID=989370 RepID=A0A0R3DG98_9BRAD|nr:hypothetical protein [Bradyrhizobium manausense]KRQ08982.1 hypothetical protein AOQ71_21605 [Bradyrhizobium manausense]
MDTRINSFLSDAERDAVIELRHAMHREPEISNAEWKTQERICGILQRFGVEDVTTFHNAGLYIGIKGTASGPGQPLFVTCGKGHSGAM